MCKFTYLPLWLGDAASTEFSLTVGLLMGAEEGTIVLLIAGSSSLSLSSPSVELTPPYPAGDLLPDRPPGEPDLSNTIGEGLRRRVLLSRILDFVLSLSPSVSDVL